MHEGAPVASPGKAAFIPGGWSLEIEGLNHVTSVPGTPQPGPGSLQEVLLGSGLKSQPLCFPGNATAHEEPTPSMPRLGLSLPLGSPAVSEAPGEPPTP